jgi:hypothetical protein
MGVSPELVPSATPERPTSVTEAEEHDEFSYTSLSDLGLILERDRLRTQLDELTVSPENSPVASQMLIDIDKQIDRITDELTHRALSRHPAFHGPNTRQRYRSFIR